jgi:hypothetical protein
MTKYHQILALTFITQLSIGQTISKQVIGTSGKSHSNASYKLSWTTGEPLVGLMTAGGNQLGNGYYDSLNLHALSIEDTTMDLQLKIYPNPTSQLLYFSHPELNSFSIQITDLNGRQIYLGSISKEIPLDISNYTQGMYLVCIENKEVNKKNTYKIIKK